MVFHAIFHGENLPISTNSGGTNSWLCQAQMEILERSRFQAILGIGPPTVAWYRQILGRFL